jgi:hypothetical protein
MKGNSIPFNFSEVKADLRVGQTRILSDSFRRRRSKRNSKDFPIKYGLLLGITLQFFKKSKHGTYKHRVDIVV